MEENYAGTSTSYAAEDIVRLGYDPEEKSDCTFPDELDLGEKKQLLGWRYLKGGHRLPREIPKIPHVDETEVYSSIIQDEIGFLELAKRLAGDAKQVMVEYAYAKQRFDMLRQERDLLKWHVVSNSKVMHIKESQVLGRENRNRALQQKLDEIMTDNEYLDRERTALSFGYQRDEEKFNETSAKFETVHTEMEEWLGRRGDYIAETTVERRQASHERRLHQRQKKKLARACALDKKWHVRIDGIRNSDNTVFDTYESTANYRAIEFDKAGDITAPIREIIMDKIDKENPLEGFIAVASDEHLNQR